VRVRLTVLPVLQFSATHQTIGQLTLPFVSFQFYFKRMLSVLRGFVWYSSSCVLDVAFFWARRARLVVRAPFCARELPDPSHHVARCTALQVKLEASL